MGDATGQALFAFGAATTGALALWWLWRGRDQSATTPRDPSAFQTPVAKVTRLWVFPVKSCGGVELTSAHCGVRGIKYDRSWVVVDGSGTFMTQRKHPRMALISPRVEERQGREGEEEEVTLHLSAPGMPNIAVETPPPDAPTQQICVWRTTGEAADVGREVAEWLSEFLGEEGCRLFYMSPQHRARDMLADQEWNDLCREGEEAGFADMAPILLLSEASLQLLNAQLENHLPMERFRPNIIISGCQPHDEDEWSEVKVGDILLRSILPCRRCKLTTVDHEKGELAGPEPLETLKKYRLYEAVHEKNDSRYGTSPLFGVRCGVMKTGTVSVGDTVSII